MSEASRTLVLLDSGAMGGSAIMMPDRTAPPKQKSMELNQQANGLRRDSSRTPASQRERQTDREIRYIDLHKIVSFLYNLGQSFLTFFDLRPTLT